ncbi:hypothetical protein OOK31_00105 [Streptomyces sp. NBC_00249]|uniref:hypothetical protein n=1 Tax=Streptomyces sp. NBC_00249 TaxID=2975690 RepID=UPI002254512C|nr:hypothetical protein [Streptomyces sp. NBC_00249]MCX5192309.1 hypothetical protein [Streptomyces sp. NBC_00249]
MIKNLMRRGLPAFVPAVLSVLGAAPASHALDARPAAAATPIFDAERIRLPGG